MLAPDLISSRILSAWPKLLSAAVVLCLIFVAAGNPSESQSSTIKPIRTNEKSPVPLIAASEENTPHAGDGKRMPIQIGQDDKGAGLHVAVPDVSGQRMIAGRGYNPAIGMSTLDNPYKNLVFPENNQDAPKTTRFPERKERFVAFVETDYSTVLQRLSFKSNAEAKYGNISGSAEFNSYRSVTSTSKSITLLVDCGITYGDDRPDLKGGEGAKDLKDDAAKLLASQPADFVTKYGTHWISSVTMGARLVFACTLTFSSTTELKRVFGKIEVKWKAGLSNATVGAEADKLLFAERQHYSSCSSLISFGAPGAAAAILGGVLDNAGDDPFKIKAALVEQLTKLEKVPGNNPDAAVTTLHLERYPLPATFGLTIQENDDAWGELSRAWNEARDLQIGASLLLDVASKCETHRIPCKFKKPAMLDWKKQSDEYVSSLIKTATGLAGGDSKNLSERVQVPIALQELQRSLVSSAEWDLSTWVVLWKAIAPTVDADRRQVLDSILSKATSNCVSAVLATTGQQGWVDAYRDIVARPALEIDRTFAADEQPIQTIAPILSIPGLKRLRLVDQQITALPSMDGSALEELDLTGNPLGNDEDIERIGSMKSLKRLHIGRTGITDLSRLGKVLPNLVELDVGHYYRNPADPVMAGELLRMLRTTGSPRTYYLKFVDDDGNLDESRNAQLSSFRPLKECTRLEVLSLAGNFKADSSEFSVLSELKGLTSLDLSGTKVDDKALEQIENLPLRELYLRVTPCFKGPWSLRALVKTVRKNQPNSRHATLKLLDVSGMGVYLSWHDGYAIFGCWQNFGPAGLSGRGTWVSQFQDLLLGRSETIPHMIHPEKDADMITVKGMLDEKCDVVMQPGTLTDSQEPRDGAKNVFKFGYGK